MKNLIAVFVLVSVSLTGFSEEKNVNSKISSVTVFMKGAHVTRSSNVKLLKGVSQITFTGLSSKINRESIRVKAPDDVKILAVSNDMNSNETDNSAEIEALTTKYEANWFEVKKIDKLIEVYGQEEKLLLNNSDFSGSESGVKLDELKLAAQYFRQRLEEIGMAKLELEKQKQEIQLENAELNKKKTKMLNVSPEPVTEVIVRLDAARAGTFKIRITYFVDEVGWKPWYDVRVDDVGKPLQLSLKASVYQRSGEDWDDVKLTLSTGNPKKGNEKPVFYTWYIDRGPIVYQQSYNAGNGTGAIKGKVMDVATGKPIPFANVILESNGRVEAGATTDFDGNYIMRPVTSGTYDLKVTYIGYKSVHVRGMIINPDQIRFCDIKMEASDQTLEEIMVTDFKIPLIDKDETISGGTWSADDYRRNANSTIAGVYSADGERGNFRGGRSGQEKMLIDGVRVESASYLNHAIVKTPTNINYSIEIPYSVSSDGKEYSVHIKDISIPVTYEYYCFPKKDEDAFLIAKLTDWDDLDLLPGSSNIYFEGTYMGKSYFNPMIVNDTLDLSIGRDKGVVVKYEKIKDFKARQTIGSNIKEYRGYEYTIKNNKGADVTVNLVDQFPMSKTKDVEVDQVELSLAKLDRKSGKLSWKFHLEPGQTEKAEMKYMVKYPKDKIVYLD
ncbi:MAG: mucoidy inhibitor MuiA family protein [Chlorobi bacterium]|nr:mucoidy inhibitor MuiA family protein [Chlorobiota bacterium]